AVRRHPFFCANSAVDGHKNFRFLEKQVVKFRTSLAADFEHVFESLGGDQGNLTASALKQRVGSHGRAADEIELERSPGAETCHDFAERVPHGGSRLSRL